MLKKKKVLFFQTLSTGSCTSDTANLPAALMVVWDMQLMSTEFRRYLLQIGRKEPRAAYFADPDIFNNPWKSSYLCMYKRITP